MRLLCLVTLLFAPAAARASTAYSLATTDRTSGTGNTFLAAYSGGEPSLTYDSNALSLTLTNASGNGYIYFFGNFAQQTLNVGDSIQIKYTFTGSDSTAISSANNTSSDGAFRVSLYNSGGTQVSNDIAGQGDNAFKNDSGYMAVYRSTSAGTNGNGNIIGQRSPTSGYPVLITTSADTTVDSTKLTPLGYSSSNLTINGSLTLTLTSANSLTLASTIGNNTTQSIIDSVAPIVTAFDEFAFTFNMGGSKSIAFSDLDITYTPVPEPGSLAAIGLAGVFLLRRRMRRTAA